MNLITFSRITEEWFTRVDIEGGQGTRHVLSQALTGTDGVVLDVARFPPGFLHHLHRHPHADQVMIPLDGTIVALGPDGEEQEVGPGQLVLLPRNEWHGARNDSGADVQVLVLFPGIGEISRSGYEESTPA